MATKYAQANMNWSASTWALTPGGSDNLPPPGDGDTADLNGKTVVMNIATVPAAGTLLALVSPGTTGQLTVALNVLGNCTINATTIAGGTNTTGIINTNGAAPGATLTVNCTALTGGSASYAAGIYHNSTGALVLPGPVEVRGGGGYYSYGIKNQTTGSVTVTGNIAGSNTQLIASGLYNNSSGPVTITGNVTGGAGSNSFGVQITGGVITLNNCNLINGTGAVAYSGPPPVWNIVGKANFFQWSVKHNGGAAADTKFGPQPTAVQMLSGVVCGDVTGTLAMARLVGKGGGLVG